jgi:transaldolase
VLEKRGLGRLKGKVAIAAAKKAYSIYKQAFESERFGMLAEKGAKPQKLLWASTGTKDPAYSDVKYVEALIEPNTINTLPLETIKAFRDHGNAKSTLEDGLEEVDSLLQELKDNGILVDDISQKLEAEGIEKFDNAYASLLKAINSKKIKQLSH